MWILKNQFVVGNVPTRNQPGKGGNQAANKFLEGPEFTDGLAIASEVKKRLDVRLPQLLFLNLIEDGHC
jgi:hypothetical protein